MHPRALAASLALVLAPALAGCASSSGPVADEAFAPAVTIEGTAERPLPAPLSRLLVVLEAEPGTERGLRRVGGALGTYIRPYRAETSVVVTDTSGVETEAVREAIAAFRPDGVLRMRLRQETVSTFRVGSSIRTSTPGMSIPMGGGTERRREHTFALSVTVPGEGGPVWRGVLRDNGTGSYGSAEQARQIVAQLATDGVVGRRPGGS